MRKLITALAISFSFPVLGSAAGISVSTPVITTEVANSTATTITIPFTGTQDITVVFCQLSGLTCAQILEVLSFPGQTSSPLDVAWDGLWDVTSTDLFQGRKNGSYAAQVVIGTTTFISPTITIDSLDVHGFTLTPIITDQGKATFPVKIKYSLAKDANVYLEIKNASSEVVYASTSTGLSGETSGVPSITNTWNGVGNFGLHAGETQPVGIYTVSLKATSGTQSSITRTKQLSIGAIGGNPQDALEKSTKAYPNPVRAGQALTIEFATIRDGATTNLRVYSLAGDLVYEKKGFSNGSQWPVTNQSGKRVGRGLYFVVLFQESPDGNVHTTKKVAVIE